MKTRENAKTSCSRKERWREKGKLYSKIIISDLLSFFSKSFPPSIPPSSSLCLSLSLTLSLPPSPPPSLSVSLSLSLSLSLSVCLAVPFPLLQFLFLPPFSLFPSNSFFLILFLHLNISPLHPLPPPPPSQPTWTLPYTHSISPSHVFGYNTNDAGVWVFSF